MTTFEVLPDLDATLIAFLKAHADLTPLHAARVATKLAAGTNTSIRIANIGGTMPWPWLWRAEYQAECWGGTEVQALELARTVCAVIYELPATSDFIVSAIVTLSPYSSPDPVSNRARYIVHVQIEATP
jgi:hypothetical protein